MAVQTTKNAALFCDGNQVGKVVSASLDISLEAMETTTVEKYFRTFVPGINSATGSVSVLYDPDDTQAVALLNTIISGTLVTLVFIINTVLNKSITVTAFVTQASIPFAVREAVVISLSLQITGTITPVL
jgi:hypothetical protein